MNSNALITPEDVARDYQIKVSTQRVWTSTKRYGWHCLTIKVGRSTRYRRADVEAWIASRTGA